MSGNVIYTKPPKSFTLFYKYKIKIKIDDGQTLSGNICLPRLMKAVASDSLQGAGFRPLAPTKLKNGS